MPCPCVLGTRTLDYLDNYSMADVDRLFGSSTATATITTTPTPTPTPYIYVYIYIYLCISYILFRNCTQIHPDGKRLQTTWIRGILMNRNVPVNNKCAVNMLYTMSKTKAVRHPSNPIRYNHINQDILNLHPDPSLSASASQPKQRFDSNNTVYTYIYIYTVYTCYNSIYPRTLCLGHMLRPRTPCLGQVFTLCSVSVTLLMMFIVPAKLQANTLLHEISIHGCNINSP